MNRRPTPEPFLWMLFSSGGMVAALMVPILLFLFGIAFPLDLLPAPDHAHLSAVLHNWITRLVLFGLCVLALFHWAHRFRYTLYDGLQLKRYAVPIVALCYGGAVVGSVIAAALLVTV
ncbi:fumarate reductase subunit FrdD [Kribbella sp. CA-245084]|uniref:fumarate reductase subunit FrdD n=1 Tax=Kribbella sp. CA-245084 TaxID=3239940 RepID=UPI003D8F22C4